MDLALFDFDGTITHRETMPDFMHAAVRPYRLLPGKLFVAPLVIGYKAGVVPGSVIRAVICYLGFCNVPTRELEVRGKRFATQTLPKVLRPEAMERIAWHKARGDTVVVVSGGLDVYLSHWARAHGVHLVCSALAHKHGRLTGRYRGKQCVRAEKARMVHALFPPEKYQRIYAYGDTAEDRELLALAHEPYYRWQPATLAQCGKA